MPRSAPPPNPHRSHRPRPWRRAAFVMLFALLTVLQALAPLLHTHVTAADVAVQSGVHMPVALSHANHVGRTAEQACGAMDEPGVITAPPELRRDPRLHPDLPCAQVPDRPFTALVRTAGRPAPPVRIAVLPHPDVVLPPAQAPPLPA